jgi:hypothetical protein
MQMEPLALQILVAAAAARATGFMEVLVDLALSLLVMNCLPQLARFHQLVALHMEQRRLRSLELISLAPQESPSVARQQQQHQQMH